MSLKIASVAFFTSISVKYRVPAGGDFRRLDWKRQLFQIHLNLTSWCLQNLSEGSAIRKIHKLPFNTNLTGYCKQMCSTILSWSSGWQWLFFECKEILLYINKVGGRIFNSALINLEKWNKFFLFSDVLGVEMEGILLHNYEGEYSMNRTDAVIIA